MSKDSKPEQTGAELVVRTLEEYGVTHVFGIPGAKIDAVFNALKGSSKIETVVCRHEQNAAFIAGGIGRMTGKAGVAIATSGPGVSNLTTGLATANTEGDPVVALGGAVATDQALKKIHQSMDAVSILRPVTKFAASIGAPDQISEAMANAFRAAEEGRPGAAYLNLPLDVMAADAPQAPIGRAAFSGAGPAAPTSIKEAARLINMSENPVVLLGMLASRPENAAALQAFLQHGHLAVVGTFQAAGAVGATVFQNFGGRVGQINNQPGDRLLDTADLVITVGYDPVEYWPQEWNEGKQRNIIHIDAVTTDLDTDYKPTVELSGSISDTLDALTPQLTRGGLSTKASSILTEIAAERTQLFDESARRGGYPIHPLRLVHDLQQFVSDEVTVCLDMGSFHLWIARYMHSFRPRQVLISNGQQTLGVALPWGIAASLVRPSEKVLSISGDGGFLFSAMELETAVRLGTNLVHMVWIDGSYNMVGVQEVEKYGRSSGVDFGPVDYIKYAEAFGATGLMINSADDILPVLKKAFGIAGPVIIGVHVDYSDNHLLFENVRGSAFH
ncbi:acetolactate synthase AlsS [Pseudoruegeria sp. SK021]|uniref:acetolactate synthase AlsS n=1 Tax=Pseudoruegeria sp. SK021 TaxID=1933035 RepID=UPI000A226703|nr:acetolactate synthase AlsS [Pseudoruegeria sp. SK021]OSP53812.1 acetolactate synthase large subunit [Pseudoruegeria sp. SK021]